MTRIGPSSTAFADCRPEVQELRERLVAQIVAESGHQDFWGAVPQNNRPIPLFDPRNCHSAVLEILLELVIVKREFQRSETAWKEISDVGAVILMVFLVALLLAGLTSDQFGTWLATLDRSSLPHWVSELFNHKVMIGAIDVFKTLVPLAALCFRLTASLVGLAGTFMLGAVWLLFSSVVYLPGFVVRSTLVTLTGLLVLGALEAPKHINTSPGKNSEQTPSEEPQNANAETFEKTPRKEANTSTSAESKKSTNKEATESSANKM